MTVQAVGQHLTVDSGFFIRLVVGMQAQTNMPLTNHIAAIVFM